MAEVSFYILPSESIQERDEFACKLIEKVYRSACFCYVLTDNAEQSQHFDTLLWTFRAGSFIPHQIYTGARPLIDKVILIGSEQAPIEWQHTLINLSASYPDLEHNQRILEILDNSEATKALGRQRYRFYQEAGINITTHKMG
jgi:DNA polymerase-3 subunit chi